MIKEEQETKINALDKCYTEDLYFALKSIDMRKIKNKHFTTNIKKCKEVVEHNLETSKILQASVCLWEKPIIDYQRIHLNFLKEFYDKTKRN